MKSEVRSPKSEGRDAESLSANEANCRELDHSIHASPRNSGKGTSVFGFRPSFGLRTSDFGLRTSPHASRSAAFTLMEVMIACGLFFMATFAILALVSNCLRNARLLQRTEVDAGMAAAQVFQLVRTNNQESGSLSGDFGDAFPDFTWTSDWGPDPDVQTNNFSRADIVVMHRGNQKPADVLSIWIFRPNVTAGFGQPITR